MRSRGSGPNDHAPGRDAPPCRAAREGPGPSLPGRGLLIPPRTLRLIPHGPGGILPTGLAGRAVMSPLVIIVYAPVVFGVLAFTGVLLGAASAGVWEAVEERARGRLPASGGAGV